MPKVSIVLPTYNGERYIRESIDSILKQSFTDWELIVVNDCSIDSTLRIVSEYAEADERIRIINNEVNKKLPASLNIGFRNAQGEYLTWTSDDNRYLPDAIGIMVDYLEKNCDTVMVCTGMNIIDSVNVYVRTQPRYDSLKMYFNNYVGACFMYRKAVLKEVGEYDVSRFLVEDYDYWLRILFYYKKIGYIDDIQYLYRLHENSLTETHLKEIHLQLLKLRKDYIDNIFKGINGDKNSLWTIFYEFKFSGFMDECLYKKFLAVFPEIKYEIKVSADDELIVYGAGNYGRRAQKAYGKRIKYFADMNKNIIGTKINGTEVISVDSLSELQQKYVILIASYPTKIYSFINALVARNIKSFAIFYN